MGSIIEFRRKTPDGGPRLGGDGKTGQILMFTGVRYERTPPAEPKSNWLPAGWTAPLQPSPAQR